MFTIGKIIHDVVHSGSWRRVMSAHTDIVAAGFSYLGSGRHRSTYLAQNKRFVLKFPINQDGLYVNQVEAKAYRRCFNQPDGNGQCYAPCRLIQNHVLMMRTVVEVFGRTSGCDEARSSGSVKGMDAHDDWAPELPSWTRNIDSTQVGYLANGRLVAYDYGSSC